jgi:oxaloacetate decarboxylase alpha subunit
VIVTKVKSADSQTVSEKAEEKMTDDSKTGTPKIEVIEVKAAEPQKPAKGKARVGITETCFRDAHQSIMATRLKTEDMLPICEAVDEVGYHSIEMWGGATFDAAMRFLHEDPWERLRVMKKAPQEDQDADVDAAVRT